MPSTSSFLLTILVLFASHPNSFASAADDEAIYEFRIQQQQLGGSGFSGFVPRRDEDQRPWGRQRALRYRTTSREQLPANGNLQNSKKDASTVTQQQKETPTEEAQGFWDRILQDSRSLPPQIPMDDVPTMDAEVMTLPPAEPTIATCPTRVEVSCIEATSGNRTPCKDLDPGEDGCLVKVVFGYKISNTGTDETQQIYSLVVQRGEETTIVTDVPDAVPTVVLEPGESVTATTGQVLEMDICGPEGLGVFDTKADVITGPPSSVAVQIACESAEGVECREISPTFNQDPDEDSCAVDVTYSYTVFNIGDSDFNIIVFERTRNDEYLDLLPLLYTAVFVPVGGSTFVQESEQIDRCIDQTFSTSTMVTKLPPADTLCQDRAYYPPTR